MSELEEQAEFVRWLQSEGIYNEFASSQTMIAMSKVWKLLKSRIATLEAEKAELEKQEPKGEVAEINGCPIVYWDKSLPVGTKFYTKPQPPAVPDDGMLILAKGIEAVSHLIGESYGVAGLHLNGDIAPWGELMEGGRFEGWLVDISPALEVAKALLSAAPKEVE